MACWSLSVAAGTAFAATQRFGLAVPVGMATTTGIAGLTLGGGIGWLMRKYGLTIDQLLSVEMVTASGELVRTTAPHSWTKAPSASARPMA